MSVEVHPIRIFLTWHLYENLHAFSFCEKDNFNHENIDQLYSYYILVSHYGIIN